jgi:nicotinate-nucleotide pyrophosphorylase (carboxylating)
VYKKTSKTKGRRTKKLTACDVYLDNLIKACLAEDIGSGDITTEAVVHRGARGDAVILAKEDMIVAGLHVAEKVFKAVDRNIRFESIVEDGASVKNSCQIARLSGRLSKILTAERIALNFLQRLSGISTITRQFVLQIKGFGVKLLDTRKTTPCLRALEKYAVKVGGGYNHRFGLFDGILIKDNHIDAVGGIREAVERAKEKGPVGMEIEVEVRNLKEIEEALASGADILMLDNMSIADIRKGVRMIGKRTMVEVSGGVSIKNIAAIARTGVDFISVGSITHSARAVDISMEIEK